MPVKDELLYIGDALAQNQMFTLGDIIALIQSQSRLPLIRIDLYRLLSEVLS